MDATEWLDDLEDKADAATTGPWRVVTGDKPGDACAVCAEKPMFIPFSGRNGRSNAEFVSAANPETVKRLVGMINYLACLAVDADKGDEDVQAVQNIQWAFEENDPKEWV